MTDLATRHLGPELRSPLVASAGPLAGEIETLVASEVARAVTVGLPSPFEEEPGRDNNDEALEFVENYIWNPSTHPAWQP